MAESGEDKDNKEFEASERRKQQARDDGDVVQSKELNGLFLLGGALCGLLVFDAALKSEAFGAASAFITFADEFSADIFAGDASATYSMLLQLAAAFVLPVGLMFVGVIASLALQRSIVISTKAITPKFDKVSPGDNFKEKFGGKGLTDFAKDAAKMLVAGAIAGVFLLVFAKEYYGASALSEDGIYDFTLQQVSYLLTYFLAFQIVLALIDYPLQRFFHARKLRMSREEMKKEQKESEGDPHLKQERKSKAAKISSGEMLKNVEEATVIMVNPEHYAVALKWDQNSGAAPVCVGKGVDHLAARIRGIAIANNIPIYRDPPTARALYRLIEVDEEITPQFYAAVAAAIQFVESLKVPR